MRCRALPEPGCQNKATEALITDAGDVLEVMPLCHEHAAEEVHEARITLAPTDWVAVAVRPLAGGLT